MPGQDERCTRAARLMREALQQGLMMVTVREEAFDQIAFMDARYLHHHAKLYIADEDELVIVSVNFSLYGLVASREAGITITGPDDVAFLVRRFHEFFGLSPIYNTGNIQRLDWLKAYARALLELHDLAKDGILEKLSPLAPCQRAVVSSVLASLLAHRGAFLIASTG